WAFAYQWLQAGLSRPGHGWPSSLERRRQRVIRRRSGSDRRTPRGGASVRRMAHEARSGRARLSAAGRRTRVSATGATTRSLAGAAFAVPPVALLGVALVLAYRGGGIVPEQWAPVAVGTAVGLAVLGAVGSLPQIPRQAWPPLGALAAFFAWSALSIVWSASPEAT